MEQLDYILKNAHVVVSFAFSLLAIGQGAQNPFAHPSQTNQLPKSVAERRR
jgi:hypothetical protein